MDKLKLLEAMNLIDDDLLKGTEKLEGSVTEAEKPDNTEHEITVSGVEIYRRRGWQRFAAIASALVLTVGVTFAGGYFLKHRKPITSDKDTLESEAVAPTTENDSTSVSTVTEAEGTETTVTTTYSPLSGEDEVTETPAATTVTDNEPDTDTSAASGKKTTTAASTTTKAKSTSAKTTTTEAKTGTPLTTTAPFPEVPADRKLTLDLVRRYAEFGDSLTFGDFKNYEGEDVGSGVWVLAIPVYTDKDGEAEFTLAVNSLTGEDSEKPGVIKLYYGEYSYKNKCIDIRYESVTDFVIMCRCKEGDPDWQNYILGDIKDCHVDFIRSVELSHPMYNYPVYLSYSEIKEMLPMIQRLTFTKSAGDEWRYLDGSFIHIKLTDNKGVVHEYELAGNKYFVVDGTGYEAPYNDLLPLDTCALSFIGNHEPSEPVDVSRVWCWHDTSVEEFSPRELSENITVKQFPDYIFTWDGMDYSIKIYNKKTRTKFGSVREMGQAYFADINGDGYPELCTTYDWGLNSRIVGEIAVWDIHNELIYRLNEPENETIYWLYNNNGELRVNRQPPVYGYTPSEKQGEQGRLRITASKLEFVKI